jgi:mediator of RNA polymerase II transcription subunit 12
MSPIQVWVHIEHHDLNWLHVADTVSIRSLEWLDASALLGPWKLAATTVKVQLSEPLKQVGECPMLGTPSWRAEADHLVAKFMCHHMSTKGADFVAEVARRVGPMVTCQGISSVSLRAMLSLLWHSS